MLIKKMVSHFTNDDITYVTLDSLVEYIQPTQYIVKSTDYDPKVGTPVLTAGASFILGYTHETENIFNAMPNRPVIIFDDFTTSFHWVDFSFKVKSSALKILKVRDESNSLFKYIYYAMRCIEYRPSQHGRQWIQTYSKFRIPLPPLPIQEEIVRVLDKFTLLKAELEAELEARTMQYDHYRNAILDFSATSHKIWPLYLQKLIDKLCPEGVKSKKLGDISEITTGKLNANAMSDSGMYPFFTCAKEVYRINDYAFDTEALLISGNGSQVGHIHYYDGKFNAYQRTYVLDKFSENIHFVEYYLRSYLKQRILEEANVSGVPYIRLNTLSEFMIPIPPLPVQEAIVDILDRFEAIVHDFQDGLPAEIALRQKQYDYYRNKLLEFPILS